MFRHLSKFAESHLQHDWRIYLKAVMAEFLGCFFTNCFACGAALATNNYGYSKYKKPLKEEDMGSFTYGQDYQATVSIAFGVVFGINIALFQEVSGAHINPAITIGMMSVKNIHWLLGLAYIPFQIAGSIAGSALLLALIPPRNMRTDVYTTVPHVKHGLESYHSLIWEVMMAMQLMLVYLEAREENLTATKSTAPLIIGVSVMVNCLAGIYVNGGCCNPAQTLGAAIISSEYSHIWVYLVFAPVGAIIGAVLHYTSFKPEPEEVRAFERRLSIIKEQRSTPARGTGSRLRSLRISKKSLT